MPCSPRLRTISRSPTHHSYLFSNSNSYHNSSSETNCEYTVSSVTTCDNGCRNRSHHWVSKPSAPSTSKSPIAGFRCGDKNRCADDILDNSGTGYIGSFTSLALLEHGYNVIIVDSLYNSSKVSLDRIELLCGKRPIFYQVDVTDEPALEKVFEAHPDIDSVIHFAALKVSSLNTDGLFQLRP